LNRDKRRTEQQAALLPEEDFQRILRSLILECPLSTWIANKDGTLLFENAANRRLFGVERDAEVIGKYNIFNDEEIVQQGFAPRVRRVFEEGGHAEFTIDYDFSLVKQVTTAHPTHKVLRTFLFGTKDEAGQVQYVVVQHEDCTETRQAERSLAASQARYRELLEDTSDLVWEIDLEGRFTYANPVVERVMGYKTSEVTGRCGLDFVTAEDRDVARETLEQSIREQREVTGLILRARHKDGSVRYLETSGRPILDEQGKLVGFRGISRDATERVQAEEALKLSEARYRAVAQDQTDLICRFLPDTTLTFVNEAYCRYFGKTREELIGQRFLQLIPEAEHEGIKQYLASLTQEHPIGMYEHRVLAPGGEVRWQQWSDRAIFDEAGRLVELQSVGRDITDRRRMEEDLRYHIEFQRLVTNISTRFINLPPDEISNGIQQALGQIGEFSGVDRSYIALFSRDAKGIESFQEWVAAGVGPPPEPGEMKGIHLEDYPWAMEKLRRFEVIHVPRLADLPPEALPEKAIIGPFAMPSLIAVPMVYRGSLVGILGFGSMRAGKTWPEASIILLRIVGEIFASALERKQTEGALRRSEETFRAIFECAPATIITYDRNAVILQANEAFERATGFSFEQLVGRSMFETFARPEDRGKNEEVIQWVFAGQTVENIEWQRVRADGSTLYLLTSITPIYNEAGEVTTALAVGIDITERKLAERRRRELEKHKREFYRRTILAATEGKLAITERDEIRRLIGSPIAAWDIVGGEDLSLIRHKVAEAARSAGMEEARLYDLVLAVGEAITNAFKHAGGGTASLHRRNGSLLFVVSDRGPGIEALTLPEVALKRGYTTAASLGMGYKAILSVADKVYLATGPTGTTVAIEMKLRLEEKPLAAVSLPETWAE